MVYTFFDKKTGSAAIATSTTGENVNEVLAEELHKAVIKKLKRRKTYSRFKENIWEGDLSETVLHDFIGISNEFKCKPKKKKNGLRKEEDVKMTLCRND